MRRVRLTIAVALFCSLGLTTDTLATVYDFSTNAGVDRFAFGIGVASFPVPPTVNTTPATSFAPADYTALGASDDLSYSTGIVEGGNFAATRFVFTIAEPGPSVTQLDVLWEGGVTQDKPQMAWLWNAATSSYVFLGSQVSPPPPAPLDGTITATFTANASEFVDASNAVTVLVNYSEEGGALLTDYVSVTITRTAQCDLDADCGDGLFCNGIETCDPVAGCQAGVPVDCDDGLLCTIDSCDETTDSCDNLLTDCNDGLYCNGVESCDPATGCQAGVPVNCEDGVICTVDSCNEVTDSCNNAPNHAACQNAYFCDGAEVCDPLLDCQAGIPVNCDDGVVCTTDSCNEATNYCDNVPDSPSCLVPNRWYVDADAAGANDGTSWADALNLLQDALAAAVYGNEIWVAAGTYKPDEGAGQTPGDRGATFRLRDGVALYGHFLGNELTLGDRVLADPADPLRQTILSGDIGVPGYALDNSHHVVRSSGPDDTVLLDAFTVTGGMSPLAGLPNGIGGGLLIDGGNPTITNSTFTGNEAPGGGGVAVYAGSPTFLNCTFTNNAADGGGGLYHSGGDLVLTGCEFRANQADEYGGGLADLAGTSEITDCTFIDNSAVQATSLGGAVYTWWAGGVQTALTNCLLAGNSAGNGGGIFNDGYLTLTNSTLAANNATYSAGGLFKRYGHAQLANTIFWSNTDGFTSIERAQILGTVSVDYSSIQGWTGALGGTGNTGGDPLFVNPAAGDYHLSSPGSACIDAGNSDAVPPGVYTDLDGGLRFLNDPLTADTGTGQFPIVDMGAYEFAAGCTTNADCDDGLFCNGTETCDAFGACQAGVPVICNDGVGCTDDACHEATDSCDSFANHANCNDGLFCDGAEICDQFLDCQPGTPVDCNDGVGCTNDACNEATDSCENAPDDAFCDDGNVCTNDVCSPPGGCVNTPNSDPCDDGDICTGGDTCNGGSCVGTPGPCLDSFLCYKTRARQNIVVTLSDQFDSGIYLGRAGKLFCTPADTTGDGIADPATHLMAYQIKGAHARRTGIEVDNQFGPFFFDTRKADTLMVPTAKSLEPNPPPGQPDPGSQVDHYRCLKATSTRGTPKFPRMTQVPVDDQFGSRTVYIKKPSKLCLPVDKDGEGIKNPEAHLMCYKVKPDPRTRVTGVQTNNQLAEHLLTLSREAELCVPSTITP